MNERFIMAVLCQRLVAIDTHLLLPGSSLSVARPTPVPPGLQGREGFPRPSRTPPGDSRRGPAGLRLAKALSGEPVGVDPQFHQRFLRRFSAALREIEILDSVARRIRMTLDT